jgi:hypothetical protein
MRFDFPMLPAEFEIPDDWFAEVGMEGFTPSGADRASARAQTSAR